MVLIRFRNTEDAQRLYALLVCQKAPVCEVELTESPETMIRIECSSHHNMRCIHTWFIPTLTSFILSHIENRWMREMIRELFYFTYVEEQEQILSIANLILDGRREDNFYKQLLTQMKQRVQVIEDSLKNFITPHISFSFESFLHFRLKEYRDLLLTTVEMAIDEYKLEQEYQTFVEQLRHYVASTPPLFNELHVIEGEGYEVFLSSMERVDDDILRVVINEGMWDIQGFDAGSSILAPIVSVAPQILHYYTNNEESGVVQTLTNVFQEKIRIYPKVKWDMKKESQIQS
ncbi:sporulation protein YtxC [Bacillus solimangrovi]|uniref:Sporulation protein YtxC n=1 Tax=Bacillus solimangrovi TaxID=1305675 RepID=A0A1E5LCS5_9BACI|nr:sporulation protein YtxC [Bacillus solimangrovi]OEH91874.1 hypothetical protein BFG57_03825 [Bacillus solimangrovi]